MNGVVELSAVQQTDASAPDSRSAPRRADMDPPVVTRWRTGDGGENTDNMYSCQRGNGLWMDFQLADDYKIGS